MHRANAGRVECEGLRSVSPTGNEKLGKSNLRSAPDNRRLKVRTDACNVRRARTITPAPVDSISSTRRWSGVSKSKGFNRP
jgi:hypothetical protein